MPRFISRKKGKITLFDTHLVTMTILLLAAVGTLYYVLNLSNSFDFRGRAGVPGSELVVYGDQLASTWIDWSWDARVNTEAFESGLSLNKVISVKITRRWGGLYLHTDSPLDSTLYDVVQFDVKGGMDGQKFGVRLQTRNDRQIGAEVYLANVGGDPLNGQWQHYTIPLSYFSKRFTTPIGGFIIQEELGQANQTFYVDNIKFLASTSVSITPNPTSGSTGSGTTGSSTTGSTPSVTGSPQSTQTPTPTRIVQIPTPTNLPAPTLTPGKYPWHTKIVSTTFWVGEIFNANLSDGSQVCSTYDSEWAYHWSGINAGKVPSGAAGCAGSIVGGCDGTGGYKSCQTEKRTASNNYFPNDSAIHPLENPFYLDLPFDDINDSTAYAERCKVIPWANDFGYAGHCNDSQFSYMKNRWVEIIGPNNRTCYGQIEDAGPSHGSLYHDANYVFGSNDSQPVQGQFNNAGMDVSPALNGCLGFKELDGDTDKVTWRFVDDSDIPSGPWNIVVTTSGVTQ